MTEQRILLGQRISDALADLLSMQAGPSFAGKTHKVAADTASLARLWTTYRDRQFEAKHTDDLADDDAHQDELDEQNALRRGEG